MAARKPRKAPTPPDGQPASKPSVKRTGVEDVSKVEDPLIAGDAGKGKRVEADESAVDNAGQIVKPRRDVDLLH